MKARKTFKKSETLIWCLVLGSVITVGFLWLFSGLFKLPALLAWVENYLKGYLGQEPQSILWSLLAAQLSLTFISISVLSILSDKDHVIYWKDLVEERLLSPRFGCFAAYTYYSETAAVISCIAVFCGCATLFFFSFIINIVVLILLTDSILDVYFSKEKHCKKMKRELQKAYAAAFKVTDKKRDVTRYNKIMDDFSVQIQRNRDDAQYMRQAFELIVNNIELFDTTNYPVREIMQYQFNKSGANVDLHLFTTVVEQAEAWTEEMRAGKEDVIYTADWLFWITAVEKWKETECFSNVHSHSIYSDDLQELEKILNRRLRALLECEKMQALKEKAPEEEKTEKEEQKEFTLPPESKSKIFWVRDKYFHLLQALFGGYVAIYAKRLEKYYKEIDAGEIPRDVNVSKYFPKDRQLLSQLVKVIGQYEDINTHLQQYGAKVINRFLQL